MQDGDAVPVDIKLFGDQGGKGGMNALTHFGAGRDDRHAIRVDQDIGVQGGFARAGGQRVGDGFFHLIHPKGHPADDRGRADQECAPGNSANTGHGDQTFCKRLAAS